jgi:hypothetical protein
MQAVALQPMAAVKVALAHLRDVQQVAQVALQVV